MKNKAGLPIFVFRFSPFLFDFNKRGGFVNLEITNRRVYLGIVLFKYYCQINIRKGRQVTPMFTISDTRIAGNELD